MTLRSWSVIGSAALTAACGGWGDRYVQRSDSAGVQIVLNTREDRVLDWTFSERLRLGGEDDGPEAFHRVGRGQVGADGTGNLFVLDPAHYRVVAFDASGGHLRSMGGRGNGPGEMEFPVALSVSAEGAVSVLDVSKQSLIRFDSAGSVIGDLPVPVRFVGGRMAATAAGLVGTIVTDDQDQVRHRRLVAVADTGTTELAVLSRVMKTLTLQPCGISVEMVPLFEPQLTWAAEESLAVVNVEPGYVLNQVVRGRLRQSIRRNLTLRPATEAMAHQQVGNGPAFATPRGKCQVDPADEVRGRGYASELPAVSEIVLGPDGTMWVTRGHLWEETPLVDVFAEDGKYLGTLPPGSPMPLGFTPSGDLLAVSEDEIGVERLVVYEIVGVDKGR